MTAEKKTVEKFLITRLLFMIPANNIADYRHGEWIDDRLAVSQILPTHDQVLITYAQAPPTHAQVLLTHAQVPLTRTQGLPAHPQVLIYFSVDFFQSDSNRSVGWRQERLTIDTALKPLRLFLSQLTFSKALKCQTSRKTKQINDHYY